MNDGSLEPVGQEAWEQAMREEWAVFMEQTRAAMNTACKGRWIADTEEVVRDAGARLRERTLEKLLQLRVQAAEGAFSPSAARRLGERRMGEQGTSAGRAPDGGRARANPAAGVVEER